MNKILLLAGAMVLFVSCKKDWTCSCTLNGSSVGSTTIKDKTKSQAKDECNEGDVSTSLLGFSVVTECEID
ncbi:MAG: hypothetical protein KC454_01340 [Flavobacteriales bacterium]|nr:hypothetical protein [Flavobacteriales bacterium]